MKIKESAENYLEAILKIGKEKGTVRSIDIANELCFSKASISVAMKNFREEGYINMDADGFITLTDKGRAVAERVYERHEVIANLLIAIGVERDTAFEDSCKIEHDLSDETFNKIKEFFENYKKTHL